MLWLGALGRRSEQLVCAEWEWLALLLFLCAYLLLWQLIWLALFPTSDIPGHGLCTDNLVNFNRG